MLDPLNRFLHKSIVSPIGHAVGCNFYINFISGHALAISSYKIGDKVIK